MCHRSRILGIVLLTAGISFILSCLFGGWGIRLLIGSVLIVIALLFGRP